MSEITQNRKKNNEYNLFTSTNLLYGIFYFKITN